MSQESETKDWLLSPNWPKTEDGTFFSTKIPQYEWGPTPYYSLRYKDYPTRYYAWIFEDGDPLANGVHGLVRNWVDAYYDPPGFDFPPANEMVALTMEQWEYALYLDSHGVMIHGPTTYIDGVFRTVT